MGGSRTEAGVERASIGSGWRRLGVAFLLVAAVAAPERSSAGPAQEPSLEEQRDEVRRRQGEVALEVDALEADFAEVQAALATLEANVATQEAELAAATNAAAAADAALTEAEAAVAQKQAEVEALNLAADELAVQAFVAPPADNAWDLLSADTMSDAAIMRAVLEMQADADASLLDLLEEARDQLQIERDNRAAASENAEAARATAATELSEVQAARDQQIQFVAQTEAALDHKLVEAANLAELEEDFSQQIAEEAAERARLAQQQAAAAAAAAAAGPPAGTITPGAGGLSTVSCHNGGSITVASSLAPNLQRLLDAAAADGLILCGGGYRNPEAQIALRRAHCGTSYYAIYQMPASQCNPPTARPGTSMHERGLAVDFVNCSSRSTACYQWLADHAANYGLYNLPSEPWHWSVNGR